VALINFFFCVRPATAWIVGGWNYPALNQYTDNDLTGRPKIASAMPPRIRLSATVAASSGGPSCSAPRGVRYYAAKAKPAKAKPATSNDREKPATAEGDEGEIDLNKEARDEFNEWMRGPGLNFKKPLYNEMNYIASYDRKTWQRLGTDKDKLNIPFPLNHAFRSHPVLSEELKEEIYSRVMEGGGSVRAVSAGLGVSLERVAAVVRLKAVEKEWIKEVGGRLPFCFLTPSSLSSPHRENLSLPTSPRRSTLCSL